MPHPTRPSKTLVILMVLLPVTVISVSSRQLDQGQTQALLERHSQQVLDVNRDLEEVFGPLPAIGSTPFLGLAVLTGVALFADQPFVVNSSWPIVRRLRRNALVLEARNYASWWLLGALVILALITGLANSGKLEGGLGKLARGGENVIGGLAYFVVAIGALTTNSVGAASVAAHPAAMSASVVPAFEWSTLTLIVAGAVALSAMMVVRFALDLVIWLNPVPFIDFVFETCKAIFSLAFLAIYLFNPLIAAILGAVLLIPCLLLLPWAARLLSFAYRIIFSPILAYVSRAFAPSLVEPHLARRIAGGDDVGLACRGNVLKARGLRKRQGIVILQSGGCTRLHPRWRKKRARDLCQPGEQVLLGRALGWIEVRVVGEDARPLDRIALPRSMVAHFDALRDLLGARDAGDFGTMKMLRAVGEAARKGVDSATRAVRDRTAPE